MAECQKMLGHARTIWAVVGELRFELVEKSADRVTVIRFRVEDQAVQRGDVLVVLEGPEICFHGAITTVEADGWAIADLLGSKLRA
jgi:hypothetical protein